MSTRRRSSVSIQAGRTLQGILIREGGKVRRARKRRRWSQLRLAGKVGISQPTVSALERGAGGNLSLVLWQQVALVLNLPLDLQLGRDALEDPADAGHLGIQELVLRLGRATGRRRTFELPTKPTDPSRSVDVGLIDDLRRCLIRIECVNSWGDVGASIRSSDRKRAEAEALAVSIGHGDPYSVHECWVVRATRRNRALVARYPELFATRFPASSRAWVAALTSRMRPLDERGLVWCDVACTRIFAWRAGPDRRPLPA
jgi:transcriptional regulator with XRE-family HTH domain